MKNKTIIINAIGAKKNAGGGFQVSLNFVKTALHKNIKGIKFVFFISKDLADEIHVQEENNVYIFPCQPDFFGSYWRVKKRIYMLEKMLSADLIYSLVSPSYFFYKTKEVMRVSNAWVTHPNKYALSRLTISERLRNFVYGILQRSLIKKCKYFIVQTNYMAEQISKLTKVPMTNIKVVSNVLPSVYAECGNQKLFLDDNINIACVAAPYPHKNIDIIPKVLKQLLNCYSIENVVFHVTIPFDSPFWLSLKNELIQLGLEKNVKNHGRLTQQELAKLYCSCSYMFLPTLLEVFSVSIIEAMYFELPIVTTDFSFNVDVLEDAALYFRPLDSKDAADKFASLINNPSLEKELVNKMRNILKKYGDYSKYFNETIEFLVQVGENK